MSGRGTGRSPGPGTVGALSLLLLLLLPGTGRAQVLTPLTLRHTASELRLLAERESNLTGSGLSGESEIRRKIATQRLKVGFAGSVLHPRFLDFSGYGGLILSRGGIRGQGLELPADGSAVDYLLAGSLLGQHPYPVDFHTSRETDFILAGQLQGYQVRQERRGVGLTIPDLLPVRIRAEATDDRRLPEGQGLFLEEHRRRNLLDLGLRPVGRLGQTRLRVIDLRTERPFYDSVLDTRLVDIDTRLRLGSGARHDGDHLLLSANSIDQTGSIPLQRKQVYSSLRYALGPTLTGGLRGSLFSQEARGQRSRDRMLQADLAHRLFLSLQTRLNGRLDRRKTTGLESDIRSASFALRYQKQTRLGRLDATLDLEERREDRRSDTGTARVFREELVLVGFDPVFLRQERILPETIAVFDSLGVVLYVEGSDYRLQTVGGRIGIERLVTGRIADGDLVLVDYDYEVGGSGLIEGAMTGWSTSLLLIGGSRFYVRSRRVRQDLAGGELDVLLNPMDSHILGAMVMLAGFSLQAEYEDQQSPHTPFLRREFQLGRSLRPEPYTRVSFNLRRLLVDNRLSPAGTDLWSGRLVWSSLPVSRVRIEGTVLFEEDTGALQLRQRRLGGFRVAWRYGRTTVTGDLQYGLEKVGTSTRRHTLTRVELVRGF
jgi:hypothetical protein